MTTSTTHTARLWASLDEFIDANKRAGGHFFDRDAARFFRSRWDDGRMYGGRFFITSEQFEGSDGRRDARRYTVHVARPDGTTGDKIGGFQAWETLKDARKIAEAAGTGYAQGLSAPAIEGPDSDYKTAYNAGHALRRYEDANGPDKNGNTRADYLREDVKRHEAKLAELRAEIARLEGGAS